jgi:hypothetical protein
MSMAGLLARDRACSYSVMALSGMASQVDIRNSDSTVRICFLVVLSGPPQTRPETDSADTFKHPVRAVFGIDDG